MSSPFLFQRGWRLTLSPRNGGTGLVYTSTPQQGTPLHVMFDVKKSLHSTSNKATFRLYNLSGENRQVVDIGFRVTLDCGYGPSWQDYTSLVYAGDIDKKTVKQEGPDIVLEVECSDSGLLLQQCHVKVSFGAPTTLANILQNIADQLNVEIGGQVYSPDGITWQQLPDVQIASFSEMGPARLVLESLLSGRNVDWSFQNGQLLLQSKQGLVNLSSVVLSEKTGLLERPTLSQQGMACRALIQADIAPGRAVTLVSSEPGLSGNFRVVEAQYKGETLGGEWSVSMKGESLGPIGNVLAPYVKATSQEGAADAIDPEATNLDDEAAL